MARVDPFADPEPLLRRVYAYVAYRVRDRSEAEDITSETFERALRYRDSFDSRKGDPVAWLLGIARNCVNDALLRPRGVAVGHEIVARDDVEEQVLERVTLMNAIASLADRDRDLLALRYGADLRPREIAAILEQTTNAVEVALSRARQRLAAAYVGAGEPEEGASRSVADLPDAAV